MFGFCSFLIAVPVTEEITTYMLDSQNDLKKTSSSKIALLIRMACFDPLL